MRISDWSSDVCSSDLGRDDRILACAPVSRRGDTVLISELKRIDGAKNFIEIPAHAHGIGHGETDLLIRIDNEDRTDRRSLALVRVDHVVEFGDLEISVRYDWKDQIRSEEHTSELQSLMRISFAVFCLTKTKINKS